MLLYDRCKRESSAGWNRRSAFRSAFGGERGGVDAAWQGAAEDMQVFHVQHHQGLEVADQRGQNDGGAAVVEDEIVTVEANEQVGMNLAAVCDNADQDPHAGIADPGNAREPQLEDREAFA